MPFDSATGRAGTPAVLFTLPYPIAAYEPMPDGRFVMLLPSRPHLAAVTRVYSDWTRLMKR